MPVKYAPATEFPIKLFPLLSGGHLCALQELQERWPSLGGEGGMHQFGAGVLLWGSTTSFRGGGAGVLAQEPAALFLGSHIVRGWGAGEWGVRSPGVDRTVPVTSRGGCRGFQYELLFRFPPCLQGLV